MAITPLSTDLNNVQALADQPNATSGLTPTQVKAVFDAAGNEIKAYINDSLIPDIETAIDLIPTVSPGVNRQIPINPNFDIWQRGISFSSSGYGPDRWITTYISNATLSRQNLSPPAGSDYYARITITTLGGGMNIGQCLESNTCNKLKNRSVSFSFQMRRNSTYDGGYKILIDKNSSSDTSGGTWVNVATSELFIPTTDWVTYTLEGVSIPSDANGIRIQLVGVGGTGPLNSYVEFAQVQGNVGSTVLPFQPRSFAEELAICQRYYEKSWNYGTAPGSAFGGGLQYFSLNTGTNTTGRLTIKIPFKVLKRVSPTLTTYDHLGASGKICEVDTSDNFTSVTPLVKNADEVGVFISHNPATKSGLALGFTADAEL